MLPETDPKNSPEKRKKKSRLTPPPQENVLAYRIPDAVNVSGVGRSTLYRLMKTGKLRTIYVCGRRLIPRDALREVLGEAA